MALAPAIRLSQHRKLSAAVESLAALDRLHLVKHNLNELYQRRPSRVLIDRICTCNVYVIQ